MNMSESIYWSKFSFIFFDFQVNPSIFITLMLPSSQLTSIVTEAKCFINHSYILKGIKSSALRNIFYRALLNSHAKKKSIYALDEFLNSDLLSENKNFLPNFKSKKKKLIAIFISSNSQNFVKKPGTVKSRKNRGSSWKFCLKFIAGPTI